MGETFYWNSINRRQFLRRSTAAAGFLAAAAAVSQPKAATAPEVNPFAYDVSRLRKTEPNLIHYEQAGRLPCPRAQPRRLTVGPDDHLYIAAGNYVSRIDREGVLRSEIALPGPARCVAVSGEGEVFVGVQDHVEVFDSKGQRRAAWPSLGGRAWLTGIAIGLNDIFLADAGQRLVLRCDRSGKLVKRIGEKDKDRNVPGFIVPSPFFDLELHRDGLLRVSNPRRHRVEAYTVDGDFEFAWGKPSAAIDGFCGCCNPINIALLPDGRFVTCEKGLPRVKVYGRDGDFESVVAGAESFPENAKSTAGGGSDCAYGGLDAAVDSTGQIHVLDLVAEEVRIMARKANASGQEAESTG